MFPRFPPRRRPRPRSREAGEHGPALLRSRMGAAVGRAGGFLLMVELLSCQRRDRGAGVRQSRLPRPLPAATVAIAGTPATLRCAARRCAGCPRAWVVACAVAAPAGPRWLRAVLPQISPSCHALRTASRRLRVPSLAWMCFNAVWADRSLRPMRRPIA
jgi:hypothetical protein